MATKITTSPAAAGTGLQIGLWGVQGLLALAFGMAGATKLTSTPDALVAKGMAWAATVPPELITFIGLSEVLGAVGLILPAATKFQPRLTAWAGVGLAIVMLLASGFHAMRGEWGVLPVNAVLGGLAGFVAWGRFGKAAIAPRA